MKRFAGLFLLAVSTAAFAADSSFEGKWDVATSIMGNDNSMVCAFTQKAAILSGTCTGDDGVGHPLTGSADVDRITFQYKANYNGQELTLIFTGSMSADNQLSGSVDVEPMGVGGDFKAQRKKQ